MKMKPDDDLFPVLFNGKQYTERMCDSLFLAFYYDRDSLRWDNSVYVGDGMSVYPDGTTTED